MKRVRAAVVFVLLNLGFTQIGWGAAYTLRGADEGKAKEGRRLFLDASIALGEGRFGDAYVIAEKLVAEHVGDCQSGLYLRLYANAFYLLDEEYREGGVRPVDTPLPEGIRTRIETLMGKQDKTLMDLVKLTAVGDKRICGKDYRVRYLKEILDRFPDSVWAEWGAMELGMAQIFLSRDETMLREHYARLYNFGKNFLAEHPDSYLTPRLLRAMANWRLQVSSDEAAKGEVIEMCNRILCDYPSAEYYCARARLRLRMILGEDYDEGSNKDADLATAYLYTCRPFLEEYKERTRRYLREVGEGEIEVRTELPPDTKWRSAVYVVIPAAIGIGAVVLGVIFLLRKKLI